TVGVTTGRVGNAALMVKGNTEYLSVGSSPELVVGDVAEGFSLSCWFNCSSLEGINCIIAKDAVGSREFTLDLHEDRITGIVFDQSATNLSVAQSAVGTIEEGMPYHVVMTFTISDGK